MSRRELKSEVTGSVWKVLKAVGDTVDDGETLLIFESMKMEIPLLAEGAGKIADIRFAEGDVVVEGDTVVIMEM